MSFTDKAKIVDRGYKSTGQYEPYLFSVVCSKTNLSISGKIGEIR